MKDENILGYISVAHSADLTPYHQKAVMHEAEDQSDCGYMQTGALIFFSLAI